MNSTNYASVQRKVKVLCLHGWRTSGKILSMQTAAMQYHTPTEYHFVDAPYSAVGPPDKGIATYYPNNPYYEWFVRKPEDKYSGLSESMDFLLQYIKEHGPFDGLLGFSQGASIVTRLARLQQLQGMEGLKLCKFVILIGGVTPGDLIPSEDISIPSLHILGNIDPLREEGVRLQDYYDPALRTVLQHGEGHNIPSMRTGLYPQISEWLRPFLT